MIEVFETNFNFILCNMVKMEILNKVIRVICAKLKVLFFNIII